MKLFRPHEITVSASRKHAVAQFDAKPTPQKIRRRVFANDAGVSSGFETIYAPAPCYDDSRFLVLANEKMLLVGACFLDSITKLSSVHGKSMADDVEIVFDPFDDGVGFVQFYFNLSGREPRISKNPHNDSEPLSEVVVSTHLPYPEAQSSAFDGVRLRRYRWWDETIAGYSISALRCRWLFAWFDPREVFRNGKRAGFNIARQRTYIDEFGSWNHASGNGSQDALSLGKLYQFDAPQVLNDVRASREESGELAIRGSCVDRPRDIQLHLVDPFGDEVEIEPQWSGDAFTIAVPVSDDGGRYRLKPSSASAEIEPGFVAIDLPKPKRAREFKLSLTYDSPMCVIANHYTPQRLDRDFGAWKALGISRVHWIEYGDWPSFWSWKFGGKLFCPGYARTVKECGDYLTAACAAAHRQELEFIADFKTFDLGMNCIPSEKPFRKSTTWEKLDRNYSGVIPEISAARGATWRANPAWQRKPNLPVTRVALYSDVELPAIKPASVKIYASTDNKRYTPIRAKIKSGTTSRRHQRWTPAGNVSDSGSAKNWFIEISGIKTSKPYLAIKIDGKRFELWHRGFMFVEAFGADGKPCVVTPATSGDLERGFFFWKGWQGWANQTESLIQRRGWASDAIGLVFDEDDAMVTMLEPAHEQARAIWLNRIQTILDAGVDGVDLRTYCHHNGPMHYLKFAFAQPVLETFRSVYGRDPECRDDDYEKIRNIRGDAYTQFVRDASTLIHSRGKKFIAEIESGVEVSSSMHCRMQLPMQWRRWITEGLIDEIRVKWYSPWSIHVHDEILPLARKHDIPVHVISRCLHQGPSHRFIEVGAQTIADAARSGFAGYSWYEQQNFMDTNAEGFPMFKGPMPAYFAAVREALNAMGESAEIATELSAD